MYRYYSHIYGTGFVVVDDDFTETLATASIWHAVVEVYSKRELNVEANFALAFRRFIEVDAPNSDAAYMLSYFEKGERFGDVGIDVDKLNRYLMLM